MKISVKARPQAKQDRIKKTGLNDYVVWVRAKAIEGQANQAVIKILSEYFDMPKSKIVLIKGEMARDKIFRVDK